MVLEIREHIPLRGDNLLDATAAEHYRIPLATVYGALAIYCDNETAIDGAIRKTHKFGAQLGARQEIKGRKKAT